MTAWLTNWLASRLLPDEREAVLGDAVERGTLPLRDLVSVLLWREVRAWTTASPWIALVTLVIPLGFVLSVIARYWAGGFAIMLWIYANNWTSEYLTNPGARLDLLVDFVGTTALQMVCLVLWSWTVGRAMRRLSGGAVGSNAAVLTAVVLAGTLGTTTIGVLNPANALVFSSPFYLVVVPFVARIVFVLVPFWRGVGAEDSTRWRWTVVRTLAAAILSGVTFKWIAGALVFGWVPTSINGVPTSMNNVRPFWWVAQLHGWSIVLRLLVPMALAWPAAYLLIQERRRRLVA